MFSITQVVLEKHILEVEKLAQQIWTQHYIPIIGQDQVTYMLQNFQSQEIITAQLHKGYEYFLLSDSNRYVGYMGVLSDTDTLKISKLYILKTYRNKGYGQALLLHAIKLSQEKNISILSLTVNKYNTDAISWYEAMGFINKGSLVVEIGGGFIMDDYLMEKPIK